MGNESSTKVVGSENVCLDTNTECRLWLNNVRHIPEMRLNLISTSALGDDLSYVSSLGSKTCKITNANLILAGGIRRDTFHFMQAKICKGEVNAIGDSSSELWHR